MARPQEEVQIAYLESGGYRSWRGNKAGGAWRPVSKNPSPTYIRDQNNGRTQEVGCQHLPAGKMHETWLPVVSRGLFFLVVVCFSLSGFDMYPTLKVQKLAQTCQNNPCWVRENLSSRPSPFLSGQDLCRTLLLQYFHNHIKKDETQSPTCNPHHWCIWPFGSG